MKFLYRRRCKHNLNQIKLAEKNILNYVKKETKKMENNMYLLSYQVMQFFRIVKTGSQ